MRKLIRAAVGSVAVAAVLAGCSSTSSNGGGSGSADASFDEMAKTAGKSLKGDPVKIGLLAPLSGAVAVLGKEMPAGADLGAVWVNEHGGVDGRPVEIVPIDTQADPKVAVSAVRKLSDQGVRVFIGTISSSEALAVMDEVKKQDAVFVAAGPHAMEMTHQKFSPNTFRVTDNAHMRQFAEAAYIAKKFPDVTQWGAIGTNNANGKGSLEAFEAGMKKFGGGDDKLVAKTLAPFGGSDYRNTLSQTSGKKPRVVMSAVYGADAVTMYQQGISNKFFDSLDAFVDNANEWQVARVLKDKMPTVVQAFHWAPQAFDNEMSTFLADSYKKKVGELPSGFSSEPFSAVIAAAAGLEKAGGADADTQDLIAGLEGLTFDSPTGERTIRAEDHQAIKDVVFGVISADPGSKEGWKVSDLEVIPGADVMDEPDPAK
ncbi:MAG: branched chain amino acid transporter, periplasmic ligandbinding protein [Marmoricola sp.]|nr:branched chain amino acid transporter, periplasmic ligandbinding protein [Marmoricola sp.]